MAHIEPALTSRCRRFMLIYKYESYRIGMRNHVPPAGVAGSGQDVESGAGRGARPVHPAGDVKTADIKDRKAAVRLALILLAAFMVVLDTTTSGFHGC